MTNQEIINRYANLKSKAHPTTAERSEIVTLEVRLQRLETPVIDESVYGFGPTVAKALTALLHRIEALEAEVDILRAERGEG